MFTLVQFLAESATPPLAELTSFGAAGLMGAMWLWERRTSRQREEQLDEAHGRILADGVQLEQLMDVVRQYSAAFARLSAVQEQLVRRMERETAR
jgi:hypothetical protein